MSQVLKQNPNIHYQPCFPEIFFNFESFPLSINPDIHPHYGFFKETFILTIPHGVVQAYGLILIKNIFIEELIWKGWRHNLQILKDYRGYVIDNIHARVAVIGQAAFHNYWHWMTEVIFRLALLEIGHVSYDYLYVPQSYKFMAETLELWGIDSAKIIPADRTTCLQADALIVPSMVTNMNFSAVLGACYTHPELIKYVRNKFLKAIAGYQSKQHLSKRIFISRKDSNQRNVINEDEVFSYLEKYGFVRYELAKLSVRDQIALFAQAEIIISPQGSGLANAIFCKKSTIIVELFQGLNDATFWFLSQQLELQYIPVATTEFETDYNTAVTKHTSMDIAVIQNVIKFLSL